jgi:hypothetical protein
MVVSCRFSEWFLLVAFILREAVGKGEVGTSPSPLSQWGQFPIFTGVRLSRNRATPDALPT